MPRNEPMPGWGARVKRVRACLKLSRAAFARHCGVTDTSVRGWEEDDSGTSVITLKRGFVSLQVCCIDRLLSWLADGEGEPPAWLEDDRLDPYSKEPAPDPRGGGPGTGLSTGSDPEIEPVRPVLRVLTRLAGEVALDAYERREALAPKVDEIVRGLVQLRGIVVVFVALSATLGCAPLAGVVERQTRGIQNVTCMILYRMSKPLDSKRLSAA